MAWTVYILQSKKDGGYYIGCSKDVRKRLEQHNSGYNKSTKFRTPFVLLCTEIYNTQAEAYSREKQIKKYKGGNAFKKIVEECVGGGVVNRTWL
ncbi:MAG: Excinuclease ABC C subunit domain protein [Parcubacteria group bacterium GW2011_GWA2_43_11]|nr:MAG: Excinuclease ABC C subunit domain protein [Parcubacteria group bacterium GW2011_GWA2_43_11]